MRSKILTLVFLVTLMVGTSSGLTVRWHWSPPETGTPVEYYEIEINQDDTGWDDFGVALDTLLVTEMPIGSSVVRVRGVDIHGREGVWSPVSEPFVDSGSPSGCGMMRGEVVR